MATLGSFAAEINAELGARQDVLTYTTFPTIANMQDTDRLAGWIKEAYDEICLGYRFEELESSVNDQMVATIDTYQLPALCRRLRAVTLIFPFGSTSTRAIRRRHIRNIRRYSITVPGAPNIYAPFNPGGQPSIIVRPVPDQGYSFIWDIVVKPTYGASIAATTMILPDDWLGVFRSLVKLKGHTKLLEPDKAQAEQTYLFGGYDPGLGRRTPGVIKQLVAPRDQLDQEDVEFGLQPRLRRYSNTA